MNPTDTRGFIAVDIGSNATKIKSWSLPDGLPPVQIGFQRHPMRLGDSVFTTGKISFEMTQRLIDLLRALPSQSDIAIRAVGTSAMREAGNGDCVRLAIFEKTGITIRVLSGEEEAGLMAAGAVGIETPADLMTLLLDIGGGSAEVIVARDAAIEFRQSMPLGAVRLRQQYFPDGDPPLPGQIAEAVRGIAGTLNATLRMDAFPPGMDGSHAIGLAGTITTLHKMMIHDKRASEETPLSTKEVEVLIVKLAGLPAREIAARYPIEPDRAEVIFAGALILRELMKSLGLESLKVRKTGIVDGLFAEFLAHG